MITTVFNESETIAALVDSLLVQTRPPDEIVVCDAGSTDGTYEQLTERAASTPGLTVIQAPGNRSAGRNAAILAAAHDVIACIDGGCRAQPDWLVHLIAPFAEGAEFVAGFYRPAGDSPLSTAIGLIMVYVREEAESADYLPSARSMAFTRAAWQAAGGFPEEVEFAEDTLFDEQMIAAGYRPAPALDAVVEWSPPATLTALAKTSYRWGKGDGLAGLRGTIYKRQLQVLATTAAVGVAALVYYPPAVVLPAGVVAVDVARRTRHKYRWAEGSSKYVLIPVAHLTATLSGLSGFLAGRRQRSRTDLQGGRTVT
ncbi:MAG: glycosyltransferase [Acidimicrobiia bacterium]|nr:glycosyltransferase [Acidimicrobiia bacterium]